jgi:hypothetical protein
VVLPYRWRVYFSDGGIGIDLLDNKKTWIMKTAEEKAIEYSNSEGIYDEHGETLLHMGYLAGHNEAMRWRDPKEELPKIEEMVLIQVQIRYTDTIVKVFPSIGILSECGLTHKMRLVDTHRSNGLIIGWRPIE